MVTKEWVIIATDRAKRPEDFKKELKIKDDIPPYNPKCPFCPGNEDPNEPEIARVNDENGRWLVRVIPNKYPALKPEGSLARLKNGIYRKINGFGIHEVIIDTPTHNLTTALLEKDQIKEIFKLYRSRFRELQKDPRIAHIVVFKNHGESAGTSQLHPHSQLAAISIVPTQIRHRVEETMRHYDATGECAYCNMINDEIKTQERIIMESPHFVAFVLYAAQSPFHLWILPKRHMASFSAIKEEEIADLSFVMKTILSKIYYGLGNPDYNYVIRACPTDSCNSKYLHWHISIVLRVTKAAGFELGSGMFINTSFPEEDAKFLRNISI